jgi:hypothetical protein
MIATVRSMVAPPLRTFMIFKHAAGVSLRSVWLLSREGAMNFDDDEPYEGPPLNELDKFCDAIINRDNPKSEAKYRLRGLYADVHAAPKAFQDWMLNAYVKKSRCRPSVGNSA